MTPKEKAEELIRKITETLQDADMYGWYNPACKNCALIVIDEIINLINTKTRDKTYELLPYWEEVKQEIERL